MSDRPDPIPEDPHAVAVPNDAPTETERALKAAALGALLGTALALLARSRDRRKGSPLAGEEGREAGRDRLREAGG
jgi:hypothetical protein